MLDSSQLFPALSGAHRTARRRGPRKRVIRKRLRYFRSRQRTMRFRQGSRAYTMTLGMLAFIFLTATLLLALTTGSLLAANAYYHAELPILTRMQQNVAAHDSLRIYDRHGVLLYQFDNEGAQHSITLAQMPVTVVNATLAIEDHDFWKNQGVSFTSMLRAAADDLSSGRIGQGGSTITQQLIKNQVLGGDVTFTRKLNEAVLAFGVTEHGLYSKRQILEMYLNSIPYSPTAYGIDAAAHEYFGYSDDPASGVTAAQHLDLAQAAMLAGIPQNPNLNDPLAHPQHADDRFTAVLQAMVRYGSISQAQADAAWREAQRPTFFHPTQQQNLAPHFIQLVRFQLDQLVGSHQLHLLSRSGLSVYTTLDLSLQNQVQDIITSHLTGTDVDVETGQLLRNEHATNGAALLVDQHSGAVRVLLGSASYTNPAIGGNFDVVTQGYRAPASTFKPIVYAAAFAEGWAPGMVVADMPTAFPGGAAGGAYKPLDIQANQFHGEITLRQALQDSLNIPAVKVMQFAGLDAVERTAERMGITGWQGDWGLSSALGSLDIPLYEMVQAYTVFANGGDFVPLHVIDRIADGSGDAIFSYQQPQPVRVLDPRVAYMITSILSDNRGRSQEFGLCSALYLDPSASDCQRYQGDSPNAWPAAAKTGTGQNYVDALTIGYTTDYTMGVWVGNNDSTPMQQVQGIAGAAPIWNRGMLAAEQGLPKTAFVAPPGLQTSRYCSGGICTNDLFLSGQALPPESGDNGPAQLPCITLDPSGGWNYANPPYCQGYLV